MLWRKTECLLFAIMICITVSQLAPNSSNGEQNECANLRIPSRLSEIEADYFTEHSPIEIDSNQDFEAVSSTGTGSAEDPYVIEKLHIIATGTQNSSISVEYTSMHFIIRDCYFQTDWAGIEIRHIGDGTGVLANNTCVSNSGGGAGIVVWGTQNCTITGNRCSNLAQGIHLNEAGRCCITSNNVSDNSYQGINIRYSYSNTITGNRIMDSSEHGVALVGTSRDNLIYGNYFVDNGKEATYRIDGEPRGELTSQGFDEGSNNTWYDAELEAGNWWSDYTGSGSYNIDGPSNSVDLYPLGDEAPLDSQALDLMQLTAVVSILAVVLILSGWVFLRKRNRA